MISYRSPSKGPGRVFLERSFEFCQTHETSSLGFLKTGKKTTVQPVHSVLFDLQKNKMRSDVRCAAKIAALYTFHFRDVDAGQQLQ